MNSIYKSTKKTFKMKYRGPGKLSILSLAIIFFLINGCSEINDRPKYSPPADHTNSMDGTMHKSGYGQPETNCVTCHGADLKGGTVGVSCYECHGKKW